VRDILEAIRDIQEYTQGLDLDTFAGDKRTLQAVVYCLIVIGEAERHISEDVKARYPEVPWRSMRGMRNFLVYEYPWMSPSVIWQTATKNLPPLVEPLQRMLEGG
jgi:uncharacterized protein with HEPN domain